METVATEFSILPLDHGHDRKNFSCRVDSLDNYLQKQAGQDSRNRIAVTYVLQDEKTQQVAGFYTLSAAAIELTALPESVRKKLPSYPRLPATLLGRLALDHSYKKRGLGEILLIDALKRSHDISLEVGSFAVVVDAINKSAEAFYKKYGFLDLSSASNKNRLFLPMKVIKQLYR